jgi:hypothetical protein
MSSKNRILKIGITAFLLLFISSAAIAEEINFEDDTLNDIETTGSAGVNNALIFIDEDDNSEEIESNNINIENSEPDPETKIK